MSFFDELAIAIAQKNTSAIRTILFTPSQLEDRLKMLATFTSAEYAELLRLSITHHRIEVIQKLLEEKPHDLIISLETLNNLLKSVTSDQVNIIAMLVDLGADFNHALSKKIKNQGHWQLVKTLESSIERLKKLREELKRQKEERKKDATSTESQLQAFAMLYQLTMNARVSNVFCLENSWTLLQDLDQRHQTILTTAAHNNALLKEMDFAYTLYTAFPFNTDLLINDLLPRYLKQLGIPQPKQPTHQDWILQPTQEIRAQAGITTESRGECSGVSYMALQALALNQQHQYNKRAEQLEKTPPEALRKKINDARIVIKNRAPLQIDENKFDAHDYSEIEGFWESVTFAQDPELYSFVNISHGDFENISQILMSKDLEIQGGLSLIDSIKGQYSQSGLFIFFKTLQDCAQIIRLKKNICLYMVGNYHGIIVAYLPQQDTWTICDANQGPRIHFLKNTWLIAQNVFYAISINQLNNFNEIETRLFSTKTQKERLLAFNTMWKNHFLMANLHSEPEQKRLKLLDSSPRQLPGINEPLALRAAIVLGRKDLVHQALENQEKVRISPNLYEYCENHPELLNILLAQDPEKGAIKSILPQYSPSFLREFSKKPVEYKDSEVDFSPPKMGL